MSKSQDFRTTFKQILACIFLFVRPKLLVTFQYEIPCSSNTCKHSKHKFMFLWNTFMKSFLQKKWLSAKWTRGKQWQNYHVLPKIPQRPKHLFKKLSKPLFKDYVTGMETMERKNHNFLFKSSNFVSISLALSFVPKHGLWTPRETIAFTARPKIQS